MPKQIYAVSSGSYSDYRVLALFETEAGAETFADTYRRHSGGRNTDATVETFTLYGDGEQPSLVTMWHGSVELWDDGSVQQFPHIHPSDDWNFAVIPVNRPQCSYVRAPMYDDRGGRLYVTANSREAVLCVLSDRAAAFKAGEWNPRAEVVHDVYSWEE